MSLWADWCAENEIQPVPAAPISVARFVADNSGLGMERLWPVMQEISIAHTGIGLADPTLGDPVAAQINSISEIKPPRSWRKEQRERFLMLPYDLQLYLIERDKLDSAALRRAQNHYAELRKTSDVQSKDAA